MRRAGALRGSDVFVVRYAPDGTAVDATPEVNVLPAASDVSITALGGRRVRVSSPQAAMLDVYDLLGRAVRRHPVSVGTTDVDLSELRPGVYAVRVGVASALVVVRR